MLLEEKYQEAVEIQQSTLANSRLSLNKLIYAYYLKMFHSDSYISGLPVTAGVKITDRCNLRCRYCSVNTGRTSAMPLTPEGQLQLFQFLAENHICTHITGGEPLLHKELKNFLTLFAEEKTPVRIFSNGTLITAEHMAFFAEIAGSTSFGFQISMDGDQEFQEYICGQKGVYEKILHCLKLLEKFDIPTRINSVVTHQNSRIIPDIFAAADAFGVCEVSLTPQFFNTRPDQDYFLGNDRIVDDFFHGMTEYRTKGYSFAVTSAPIACDARYAKSRCGTDCPAGVTACEIDHFGNVYPCSFLDVKEFFYGNIQNDSLSDIWKNKAWDGFRLRLHEKNACAFNECNGYCPASSWFGSGSLNQCDTRCEFAASGGGIRREN